MNCIYLSVTLEKRNLTFEEHLDTMRTKRYSSIKEIDEKLPRDKEVVIRLNTMDMTILIFTVVAVVFLIAILIYKAFFAEPSRPKEVINHADSENYTNVVFTKKTLTEDFDYPYEDIGDELK